jgi:branched-chain amino acid transport system ATP-binding protein
MAEHIFSVVERINQGGVTVLLVEQKVSHALKMCHRGYVLENGRVVITAGGEELIKDERVRKAYLAM